MLGLYITSRSSYRDVVGPPRLAPLIVRDRYSSECRVARAGRALRAHDASPEPMGSTVPFAGPGATVGPVGTGVWRAHSPQASHTGQSDETTEYQASPPGGTRGNSPRGPEEETRASGDPSFQGTLPRRQRASRESNRNPPQASSGLKRNVAAKEVRQDAHGPCHAHVVTQAPPLSF